MIYTDSNYYINEYRGNLSVTKFNSLVKKASLIIDDNINRELDEEKFNKLSDKAQDRIKYTACALIDFLAEQEKSKNVASISIDGVSKTYKTMTNDDYRKKRNEVLNYLPKELVEMW